MHVVVDNPRSWLKSVNGRQCCIPLPYKIMFVFILTMIISWVKHDRSLVTRFYPSNLVVVMCSVWQLFSLWCHKQQRVWNCQRQYCYHWKLGKLPHGNNITLRPKLWHQSFIVLYSPDNHSKRRETWKEKNICTETSNTFKSLPLRRKVWSQTIFSFIFL